MNLAGVERVFELETELERMQRRVRNLERHAERVERELRGEIERVRRSFKRELVLYQPPPAQALASSGRSEPHGARARSAGPPALAPRRTRRGGGRWPQRRKLGPCRAHDDGSRVYNPAMARQADPTADGVAVRLAGVRKLYGDVVAVDRRGALASRPTSSSRCSGPSGSGKTTCLRMIAGFERPDEGVVELRGTRRDRRAAVRARREHRLPGLRALPAHVRGRERGVRAAHQEGAEGRAPPPRRRGARAGAARGLRGPAHHAAVGRAAPARRARPRARQPAGGAAARRAARRARPEAPPADAERAAHDPGRGGDHVRLRDPRPGGGAHHERPPGRVQRRPRRAGGRARGRVRAPGQRVRGRLRRRVEHRGARRAAA